MFEGCIGSMSRLRRSSSFVYLGVEVTVANVSLHGSRRAPTLVNDGC